MRLFPDFGYRNSPKKYDNCVAIFLPRISWRVVMIQGAMSIHHMTRKTYEDPVHIDGPSHFQAAKTLGLRSIRYRSDTYVSEGLCYLGYTDVKWAYRLLNTPAFGLFVQRFVLADINESSYLHITGPFVRGVHRSLVDSPHKGVSNEENVWFAETSGRGHKALALWDGEPANNKENSGLPTSRPISLNIVCVMDVSRYLYCAICQMKMVTAE